MNSLGAPFPCHNQVLVFASTILFGFILLSRMTQSSSRFRGKRKEQRYNMKKVNVKEKSPLAIYMYVYSFRLKVGVGTS